MPDLLHRALRRAIERPERVHHWGQPHTVTPRLCERIFGDGAALIHITPLNTRPNYYAVRVDSSWALTGDEFYERLDSIYGALEDEYGAAEDDELGEREWPALDLDAGSSWGRISWPKMHRRPRVVRRFGSQVRPCPACAEMDGWGCREHQRG